MFLQGIAGTLELFHLGLVRFPARRRRSSRDIRSPCTSAIDQAGQKQPLDHGMLDDTDTLMVFGLDHMVTEQEAAPEEIEALREFLAREGTCLILGPHHDVGVSNDLKQRAMEYAHHGDRARAPAAAVRPLYTVAHERPWRAGRESVRSSSGHSRGNDASATAAQIRATSIHAAGSRASQPSTSIRICRTTP